MNGKNFFLHLAIMQIKEQEAKKKKLKIEFLHQN